MVEVAYLHCPQERSASQFSMPCTLTVVYLIIGVEEQCSLGRLKSLGNQAVSILEIVDNSFRQHIVWKVEKPQQTSGATC